MWLPCAAKTSWVTEADQTVYARAIQPIPITVHKRRPQREVLSRHEHQQVITKRGAHGWLAQQTMITLMAPLIDRCK